MFVFRDVTPAIVQDLVPRLRPIDRLELDCMSDGDPVEVLFNMAQRARRVTAAYMADDLVGIMGVSAASIVSDTGCPWALVTDAIDQPAVRREFLAQGRVALDWLGDDFRRLWNIVSAENATAIRWLKWMGFTFTGRGIELRGHRFLHFEKEV